MGVEGTENKKIAANKILDKFLPRFLERAENMLIENGGEFFVGKEVCLDCNTTTWSYFP